MVQQFGQAAPVTCPACGVGAASGLCTLTRGEIVTLSCGICGLQVRDGIVLQHGIDIDPDEIRDMADARQGADPREWYITPEARALRLVPIPKYLDDAIRDLEARIREIDGADSTARRAGRQLSAQARRARTPR